MKEKLGFGCLGNGTTVWDSSRERGGDYITLAHISDDGSVITIRESLSMEARDIIVRDAIKTFKKNYSKDSTIPVIVKHEWNRKIKLKVESWEPFMINKRYIDRYDKLYIYVSLLHPLTCVVGDKHIKLYDLDFKEDIDDKYAIDIDINSSISFKTFNEAYSYLIQIIKNGK